MINANRKSYIIIGLLLSLNILAQESLTLFINTSEGGEKTERRIADLKEYLHQQDCPITNIETQAVYSEPIKSDFIFSPLEYQFPKAYQQISKIKVINNAPLSSSILVRAATGIDDIKALSEVHIAFLSEQSVTGYQLAQELFNKAGVEHHLDKMVFTQTNIGAMSLLIHKDAFAAVVATPLADKWSKANGFKTVMVSQEVTPGGLWASDKIAEATLNNCQAAFEALTTKNRSQKNALKVFPGWVVGFEAQ
jgi:hypothetical protein